MTFRGRTSGTSFLSLQIATLSLFFGGMRSYTGAELALTLAQLTAADQALCSSGDVAHVAVGSGLLLVDVSYPANRRLVETFTLKHLASNPFGLEATQGMTGYTLQEAMLMCGSGLFASLSDIYMELFEVPVGSVDVLEASQKELRCLWELTGSTEGSENCWPRDSSGF